ncbi:MAG: hypothetical protein NT116_02870 [Candidatus Parcubacteria bacterium]|nr:hypothetical protein [Candidatus Parcubacteria bacterium]
MDFIVEHPIVCIVIFLTIITFLWLITEVIWVMFTNRNPLIYLFWQLLFANKTRGVGLIKKADVNVTTKEPIEEKNEKDDENPAIGESADEKKELEENTGDEAPINYRRGGLVRVDLERFNEIITAFEEVSIGNKFTVILPNDIIVVAIKLSDELSRTIQIKIPHYLEMQTTQKVFWDKTKKDEVWELKNFEAINIGQEFSLPNVQENGLKPMSLIKFSTTEAQTTEDPVTTFTVNNNEKVIILKK